MCRKCQALVKRTDKQNAYDQISFEPGLGAYQGLAQIIKVPFSEGSRAISKPTPSPGTHQNLVEGLSDMKEFAGRQALEVCWGRLQGARDIRDVPN